MKPAADLHSSTINQIVTHHSAARGFDAHGATLRQTCQTRRDPLLKAPARAILGGVTWTHPQGGMLVWLALPAHLDGPDLLATSIRAERVVFGPDRALFADGSNGNSLRLSFSCACEPEIDEGMRRRSQRIATEIAA